MTRLCRGRLGVWFLACGFMTAVGCSSTTVTRQSESGALLRSAVPIVSVDATTLPDGALSQELSPGDHEVIVLFRSLTSHYHCRFRFTAAPGQDYEIIVRSNPEPVTLYRVVRHSWWYGTRYDEILPERCDSTNG